MTNENDSGNPSEDKKHDSDYQSPPSYQSQDRIGRNATDGSNRDQETSKELAREFRWVEWAQVLINGALVVIGIMALCIYHGQLRVMSGQLDEIIKQYPEIQKSADAAKRSADTADQSFKTSDRPYLVRGVWAWITNGGHDPGPSHQLKMNLQFLNIGKSPSFGARNYRCMVIVKRSSAAKEDTEFTEKLFVNARRQVDQIEATDLDTAPGDFFFVTIPLTDSNCPRIDSDRGRVMSADQFNLFANDQLSIEIVGGTVYRDSFFPRETQVCEFFYSGTRAPTFCKHHNSIR